MIKKIFKTKQFIILIILILFLIGIWFLFAFLVKEERLPRYSLWATLVFGTGTIITSVISLGISILSYRKNEELRHQRVIDDANKFIDENSSEILYIPLCLIANAYNSHHKYNREIYNKFNLLNPEIKKEVLNQLQYEYPIIKNSNWIDSGIDVIRKFIQENDLGKDGLYDGAKYFHLAMEYAGLPYDLRCEFKHIMPDTFKFDSGIFPLLNENDKGKITFHNYVLSYLDEKNKNSEEFKKHKDAKPLDVLKARINFGSCVGHNVAAWMMHVVETFAVIIESQNQISNDEIQYLSVGDAVIETFEDRYLDVLMELYNLHICLKNNKK